MSYFAVTAAWEGDKWPGVEVGTEKPVSTGWLQGKQPMPA